MVSYGVLWCPMVSCGNQMYRTGEKPNIGMPNKSENIHVLSSPEFEIAETNSTHPVTIDMHSMAF